MKGKIIKFPNTQANQMSDAAKLALQMEAEKNQYQGMIQSFFSKDDWHTLPDIDGKTLEMLALFGDVMFFTPEVSRRVISKLAEQVKKKEITDPLEDYLL